jgi:hypothetical protein
MTARRISGTCPPNASPEHARGTNHAGSAPLSPLCESAPDRGDKSSESGTAGQASRGWQSSLAKRLNTDRRKVNDVLLGKRTSARVAAAITVAVGQPASQLWPGRYPLLEFAERLALNAELARQLNTDASTGSTP